MAIVFCPIAADPDREPARPGAVGPPLTGASSTATPRSANWACSRRTTAGELVERSKRTLLRRMPWMRPFAPVATAVTSGGPGREVKTTSAASPTARGVSFQTAPFARCGAALSRRRSCTQRVCPAACRFDAMLPPMSPSPMNPTFMVVLLGREDTAPADPGRLDLP